MKKFFSVLPLVVFISLGINFNLENYSLAIKTSIFDDLSNEEIKNYYSALPSLDESLKKDALLSSLQNIILKDHKMVSHNAAWNSNWNYFCLLDRDYEASPLSEDEINNQKWVTSNFEAKVLYTPSNIKITNKPDGNKVNREHIWPKSRGFKRQNAQDTNDDEEPYAATDLHNLRMGEINNNQKGHSNYPFGEVKSIVSATKITDIFSNEVTGYVGKNANNITVYEPLDKDKGDVARSLFYMATRYHTFIDDDTFQPSLKLVDSFSYDGEATSTINVIDTKTTSATYGIKKDLLERNKLDPVDEFEKHRNNLCYKIVQGNRNPYVDYPLWANIAFGESTALIDLSSNDGIKEKEIENNSYLTLTSNISSPIYVDDTLNLNDIKITFNKNSTESKKIALNDPNLSITLINDLDTLNIISSSVKLVTLGKNTIRFRYNEKDKNYEASLDIDVLPKEKKEDSEFLKYLLYLSPVIVAIILGTSIFIAIKNKRKKKK